jgi:hypothetical protein
LPIYCTWNSRQNIKEIANIFPSEDEVAGAGGLADDLTGLPPESALSLTRPWRDHVGFPRLIDDGFVTHEIGKLKIVDADTLNVADANLMVKSFVPIDVLGLARHSAIHSLRMGHLVGEIARDGYTSTHRRYLETLVQPEDADQGEPVQIEDQQAWLRDRASDFEWAGWRLAKITVYLTPYAKLMAGNPENVAPSPRLEILAQDARPGGPRYATPCAEHTYHASWAPGAVLLSQQTDKFTVLAWHVLFPTPLGSRFISATRADEMPPELLPADDAKQIHWSAALQWEPIHY